MRSGRISNLLFGLLLKGFFLFLSDFLLFKFLLLNLRPLLFLNLGLLIFQFLLLLLSFIDLIQNNLESLIEQGIQLGVILEIELNESAFSGIPALSGVGFFLVLLEKISHFAFYWLLTTIWETLIEVINDFLFALKGTMHHLY